MEQNVLLGIGVAIIAFERVGALIKNLRNGNQTPNDMLIQRIDVLVAKIDLLVSLHKK